MDRRAFIKSMSVGSLGAFSNAPFCSQSSAEPRVKPATTSVSWGLLLHLGYNMWCDWDNPSRSRNHTNASASLRFDDLLWNDLLEQMAGGGLNLLVIDLGEGVRYDSHPELAVEGSWSTGRLKRELARVRALGIEPIPKMNFSATHDAWLGKYSRCLSTERYYAVCSELIAEAIDLFDQPRLFHLGMDEETAKHQRDYEYAVIRQNDLWWKDFYFYVNQVERGHARPWIWSDYVWHHPKVFFERMPRSVVQSNWYYDENFDLTEGKDAIGAYLELQRHGYDQIPTGSNWTNDVNFGRTVDFAREHIDTERLLGFLHAPWRPTLEEYRGHHEAAIQQVAAAKT